MVPEIINVNSKVDYMVLFYTLENILGDRVTLLQFSYHIVTIYTIYSCNWSGRLTARYGGPDKTFLARMGYRRQHVSRVHSTRLRYG